MDVCAQERSKDGGGSVSVDADLTALLLNQVKCKKPKPASTKETRKEAFDRYMNILYGVSPIKIDLEDTFDPYKLLLHREPSVDTACHLPNLQGDVGTKSNISVSREKRRWKAKVTPASNPAPKTPSKVKPEPLLLADELIPAEPVAAEGGGDEMSGLFESRSLESMLTSLPQKPQDVTPQKEQLQPKSPTVPAQPLQSPTPLSPLEPASEPPVLLKELADADGFKVSRSETSETNADGPSSEPHGDSLRSSPDLTSGLLEHLNTCGAAAKLKILAALQDLHSQGLVQDPERLCQSLLDFLPQFVKPQMAPEEQKIISEMLNLLVRLRSDSYDLITDLLALLAYEDLGLRLRRKEAEGERCNAREDELQRSPSEHVNAMETVVQALSALGVDEPERWLWMELECWCSELTDRADIWKSLRDRADRWLQSWISKFKGDNRQETFSVADVLNYSGSVQKAQCKKVPYITPEGQKDAVLLPQNDSSFQPILRLGETHSMARTRRRPGATLPPLQACPSFTHFPCFIAFPLTRVTLSPFRDPSDTDWQRASPRSYFIRSYVKCNR